MGMRPWLLADINRDRDSGSTSTVMRWKWPSLTVSLPSRLSKLLIWTLTFPSSNQTRRYWLVEFERTRSKPCERRVRTNMDTVLLSPGLSSTVNTAWLSRASLPNLAVTYSDNTKVNSRVRQRYNKEYAQDCFCDCCSVYALSKWYEKIIFSDFFLLFIT